MDTPLRLQWSRKTFSVLGSPTWTAVEGPLLLSVTASGHLRIEKGSLVALSHNLDPKLPLEDRQRMAEEASLFVLGKVADGWNFSQPAVYRKFMFTEGYPSP